jgi:exosome complex RNA-binding protein Rrp42 (RNase PH superfamily)
MIDKTIVEVAIFDGELVIILDDDSEVCIFENENGLVMQVNEREELH